MILRALFFSICSFLSCQLLAQVNVTVDLNERNQTIRGFGASDAWNTGFVGKYWSETEKEAIARLLFSKELNANGQFEGIGLSRWRFNIGAGSAEQGTASEIGKEERRVECFLNANGTYDWSKQEGQQWFLQKAKEYGVESLTAFVNSPPVHLTRNNLAFGDGSDYSNLQTDKYDEFADFISNVLVHFHQNGLSFDWISPVNEPQYLWNGGSEAQEGCTWKNSEIKTIVEALDVAIREKELETKIMVSDAADYDYLHQQKSSADKSDHIWNFFDASRPLSLLGISSVPKVIAGHTYWTYDSDSQLRSTRENVRDEAANYGVELFQTEYSNLSIPDESPSSYMDYALFMGKLIYADLSIADASVWNFWTALDRERWSQMNRFYLVRLIPQGGDYADLDQGGTHADSKTLWVMGNYSAFIRPGFERVDVSGVDNLAGLMGSAYISPDLSRIVLVYVNMNHQTQSVNTDLVNLPVGKIVQNTTVYVTDANADLANQTLQLLNGNIDIPARSVTTVVYDLDDITGVTADESFDMEVYPNPFTYQTQFDLAATNRPVEVSVFDVNGNKVYHTFDYKADFFGSNLKPGVYTLQVRIDEQVMHQKLIKIKE